jgi:PadR family transcriptional regulator, regulatory protein PadR
MRKDPQVTIQTFKVLRALIKCGGHESYQGMSGSEISRITGLASGTLYPLLARLEEARWLIGSWETGNPRKLGRPPRRFYTLTRSGEEIATAIAGEMRELIS